MKKIYCFLAAALLCFTLQAQENYQMVIHKQDGSRMVIPTTEISQVEFMEQGTFTLQIAAPQNIKQAELRHLSATFTNTSTHESVSLAAFTAKSGYYEGKIQLPNGTYQVTVDGEAHYNIQNVPTFTTIRATAQVEVANGRSKGLVTKPYNAKEGLVLSEIYFSGSVTEQGQPYGNDQYIIVSNNSDHVIYADSVAVLESQFMTNQKYEYTPNVMNQAMAVHAVYMIPGNGKEHPLQPGESLLLALNAIDHRPACSTSFDLSHANFEFYDLSTNPKFSDVDNADVPNLDRWFTSSKTLYMLHNRGAKAIAIAQLRGTKEDYLKHYPYHATYDMVVRGNTYHMEVKNTMLMPNTWILDAVNLSPKNEYAWNVVAPTLDNGFTYAALNNTDKTRYGLSVIRKRTTDGRWVDTNNSTEDFNARSKASLRP